MTGGYKLNIPLYDYDQKMTGECATCKQIIEVEYNNTKVRVRLGSYEAPAVECPNCKATVFVIPKVQQSVKEEEDGE